MRYHGPLTYHTLHFIRDTGDVCIEARVYSNGVFAIYEYYAESEYVKVSFPHQRLESVDTEYYGEEPESEYITAVWHQPDYTQQFPY